MGISLNDTAERLEQLGVSFELHADWSLLDLRDCLREGWFPIVGIQRRFFGHPDAAHAVVVVAISKQTISILDPLGKAKPEPLRLTTFELAWRAARYQALIIQSPFPL